MTEAFRYDRAPVMSKFVFILGAPNGNDGELSTVSLRRIEAAVECQRSNQGLAVLATGGFGPHFNSTDTPHREFVYRHLEALGAAIDRAESNDLLSSNTVEDIVLIVAFTKARGVDTYWVVTSEFHAPRCRFIIDCLAENQTVSVVAANDPEELANEAREHEARALRQLSEQGGVVVGSAFHAHPACSRR